MGKLGQIIRCSGISSIEKVSQAPNMRFSNASKGRETRRYLIGYRNKIMRF
jgi:hypothetical protein